ncbi:Protein T14G11.1 [Aphelenchoides avenae]|nr:Protein T14G11.1 [Aphelenchus avenae]
MYKVHIFVFQIILALCGDWISVSGDGIGELFLGTTFNESDHFYLSDLRSAQQPYVTAKECTACMGVGGAHFWLPARYGTFREDGRVHYTYHYGHLCLLDCITPKVANYFYIIIALCFVIAVTASFAGALHFLAPPLEFLTWLRRNNILEVCNIIMVPTALAFGLLAELEVESLRHRSDVSFGPAFYLAIASGFLTVIAAAMSLRHRNRIQRYRREHNQRLMCTRTLRSWRDVASRRAEDTLPIISYERYLLEPSATLTPSAGDAATESSTSAP